MIRRREFITLLGGAAAWPLAARAQQLKRVGVLMSRTATEPWLSQLTIFMQGMRKLGWIEGQDLQTVVRWSAGDPSLIEAYATDLVGLFKPDALLSQSTVSLAAKANPHLPLPCQGTLLRQVSTARACGGSQIRCRTAESSCSARSRYCRARLVVSTGPHNPMGPWMSAAGHEPLN